MYDKFKNWNPKMAEMVVNWRPWGSYSICLWLRNGMIYKARYYGENRFIMQTITEEDVNRKYDEVLKNEDSRS